jgi:hypothetical protein
MSHMIQVTNNRICAAVPDTFEEALAEIRSRNWMLLSMFDYSRERVHMTVCRGRTYINEEGDSYKQVAQKVLTSVLMQRDTRKK